MLMAATKRLFGHEFRGQLNCDEAQKRQYLTSLIAQGMRGRCGAIVFSNDAHALLKDAIAELGADCDLEEPYFLDCGFRRDSAVSYNPFEYTDGAGIAALLISQMASVADGDLNGVFWAEAGRLIEKVSPFLEWLRDFRRVTLTPEVIRVCFEFESLCAIVRQTSIAVPTLLGDQREIDLKAVPEDVAWQVKSYLLCVPGFQQRHPLDYPGNQKAKKYHSFALFYFSAKLSVLSAMLGGLFNNGTPAIDLEQNLRQRELVIVNVPYCLHDTSILGSFGKLSIAALSNSVKALLHERFVRDVAKANGALCAGGAERSDRPMFVVFDGFTDDLDLRLDRLPALAGRENIQFVAAEAGQGSLWFAEEGHERQFLDLIPAAHGRNALTQGAITLSGSDAALLETYDPDWERRWDAANEKLIELIARQEFGASYKVFEAELHAAYHAQFRTALEYAEHFMPFEVRLSDGLDVPLPYFTPTMSLEEVRDLLARYRRDRDMAKTMEEGPPTCDPPGIFAFTSPAQIGAQRYVEDLCVTDTNGGVLKCRLVVEATPMELHICFVEFEHKPSVTMNIEKLANSVYNDRFRPRGFINWVKARMHGSECGRYLPDSVRFYEVLPCAGRFLPRQFDRVELQWTRAGGFHNPDWHRYPSIPVFIDYVMGLKTADDYEGGRHGAPLALSAAGEPLEP